jgi:serine protease AprX
VSGIAAGNGYRSTGLYMGIAPSSGIVGVKTLDSHGKGTAAEMLAGLQWVVDNREKYNIRVINLSVGSTDKSGGAVSPKADVTGFSARDPLVRAVEAAWDLGICIVAAAGNNGPAPGSVTSPGVSRKVITVGASDDSDEVEIMCNAVRNYSGRGPTRDCIVKPDVLAPGADIVSAMTSPQPRGKKPIAGHYLKMSGTSMATPMVSGAVALLLERSPELTPNDVKYMLLTCAADLNDHQNHRGCGILNIGALLREEAKHVRDL